MTVWTGFQMLGRISRPHAHCGLLVSVDLMFDPCRAAARDHVPAWTLGQGLGSGQGQGDA